MKVAGHYMLDAPPGRVWPVIHDPTSLVRLIPGCEKLEQIGPAEYRGQMQLRLAAVAGKYETRVKLLESGEPYLTGFEGEVSGPAGSIRGSASFRLLPAEDKTLLEYEGQGMIAGALATMNGRFVEGVARSLINQGLATLNKQLKLLREVSMARIIDLSLPIGEDTLSPPSVSTRLKLTSFHRGPGFWQASKVEMVLHTGSHVDFTRHVQADGETAADVPLDRVCGEALVVDLSFVEANHKITVADLEAHAPEIHKGDIVLVHTGWAEKQWGNFPTYYLESPYCSPEAAQWLVDRGAKAIGFDCFSEYCARLPDFTSEEFVIHKIILESGSILMQQMTNLSQLPKQRRFQFFAPFIKMRGAEGAPARFFAILD